MTQLDYLMIGVIALSFVLMLIADRFL